jgi:hypothetical protein
VCLREEHSGQDKVFGFSQICDPIHVSKTSLLRPASGILDPADRNPQARPFCGGGVEETGGVRARIHAARLIHGLEGSVRLSHGLTNPCESH